MILLSRLCHGYRGISHCACACSRRLWKLERMVLRRLRPDVLVTGNFSEIQSAYRVGHSTESELLKVVKDVVTAACDRQSTVLLSLGHISAVCVPHYRSHHPSRFLLAVPSAPTVKLSWLQSFLTDWKQYVAVGAYQSVSGHCCSPCTSHQWSHRAVCTAANMPTTRNCTMTARSGCRTFSLLSVCELPTT